MYMRLNNQQFVNFLKEKGVNTLYHANTEVTSQSFINHRALLSRGVMEDNNLKMTSQASDSRDKEVNVWYDIFFDDVDIHKRASRKNHYGGVLFCFDVDILLDQNLEIYVTKTNPIKWSSGNVDYFQDMQEIYQYYTVGTFGQMITLKNMDTVLRFQLYLKEIVLDDDTDLYFVQLLNRSNIPYSFRRCACCR